MAAYGARARDRWRDGEEVDVAREMARVTLAIVGKTLFDADVEAARPKLAYFPFGAGPRKCIGESFAWMEGVMLLATIAQRWRMRLVPGHPVELQPLITLRPKHGMRMRLERR